VGKLCVEVTPNDKIAWISEDLCIGCGICVKASPASQPASQALPAAAHCCRCGALPVCFVAPDAAARVHDKG